ncbi:uncharacterized protein F5147DRAFT_149803 [Suillus discolor]|uniref:BTB domain-containing protein n=1 Tax=Suillus discolor TaxID=1912936 RepID=A0A9P7F7J6_9AGAM|nr:uncharacterized protein F5147DRAFT_149803 [Suillus discolor]KAG2109709.1 hypothetical protein F5147DRAFT_149803 [Suillus discolor]
MKFEAAESHIHQDQGTDVLECSPSRSQPPSSTSHINVGEMEQNPTALQKVSDGSTTPSVCANKDDAKTRCKTKGKRKATDGTISKEPGKGHSRKRAKSNHVTPRKHEDFYISDANTVIEVDGVLFKLHRSRLVSKSLFFAQLLENYDKDNFPNDDVRVEVDDKVTVYHLGNTTTADDFTALLKFDDNPTEYYFQPPSFLTLAPIICAATALRFETYRTWAVRVLEHTWSSSLEDLTPEPKEDAAGVIILARSCGLNGVMKRALYELARTRRISLYDDVLGQSVLPQIGRADERCVGLMKELLVTTWSEVAVRIDTFPCRDQPFSNKIRRVSLVERDWDSPDKCPPQTTQQVTWNERVHDSGLYTKFLFDPVCGAQELINIPWKEESWCADCVRSRRAAWRKMQQDLWTEMDKLIPDIE